MSFRSLLLSALSAFALGAWAPGAAADELGEVTRLREIGQPTEALKKADEFLAGHPKDAQMRFAKGSLLVDLKRNAEAVTLLESLTEDYPDLAEPYNNLAALYASSGDFAKARRALEQALRLKPGYATAHENMGDLYTALAAQSYAMALRLEPNLPGVQGKLEQLRHVGNPSAALPAASAAAKASAAN